MKIELDKSLDLPLTPGLAWDLLQDIEGVAACLPGARITERIDETHYKGTVTVKLGPATVAFKGTIEIAAKDAAARRMQIIGKGSDAGNASGASLDLTAWIEAAEAGGSTLKGHSEVSVTGKVASFGARLMNSVSEVLIKQFFDNMLARANAMAEAQPRDVAVAAVAAMSPQGVAAAAVSAPALAPAAPAPVEAKFNLLAFIWAVTKDYLRNLFGRTKSI
jgi:carbon monoxide dehydrogenase subunit G